MFPLLFMIGYAVARGAVELVRALGDRTVLTSLLATTGEEPRRRHLGGAGEAPVVGERAGALELPLVARADRRRLFGAGQRARLWHRRGAGEGLERHGRWWYLPHTWTARQL